MTGTVPPMVSVMAGAPPLYGTASRSAPLLALKLSPATWAGSAPCA
jgi:hypothetical protein